MGRLIPAIESRGRVVPGPVLSAREQAAQILADARAQADRVLAQVATVSEDARQAAHTLGWAAGHDEGLAGVTELMVQARANAVEVGQQAAQTAIVLARRMAEKIVGRAVQEDPTLMADLVTQALQQARARAGDVVVRVHPADLAAVQTARPDLLLALGTQVTLQLVSDDSVGRAGCVVQTPLGRLDARLETQLDALENALFAARGGRSVPPHP